MVLFFLATVGLPSYSYGQGRINHVANVSIETGLPRKVYIV